MINSEQLSILAAQRIAELHREAAMSRLAAALPRRRRIRLRRRGITVEIHLSADVRPEQVDQFFASLARHLGAT